MPEDKTQNEKNQENQNADSVDVNIEAEKKQETAEEQFDEKTKEHYRRIVLESIGEQAEGTPSRQNVKSKIKPTPKPKIAPSEPIQPLKVSEAQKDKIREAIHIEKKPEIKAKIKSKEVASKPKVKIDKALPSKVAPKKIIHEWPPKPQLPLEKEEPSKAKSILTVKKSSPQETPPKTSHAVSKKAPADHLLLETHEVLMLPSRHTGRRILRRAYEIVVSLILIFVIVVAIFVYGFKAESSALDKVLTYVPLPYGFVGYHPLWYGSIQKETSAIMHFYSQQNLGINTIPSISQIKSGVETATIRRILARDLAQRYGIWVTQKEVDKAFEDLIKNAGSEEQVVDTLNNLWGWSVKDYRANVLLPFLTKQKLLEVLREDPVIGRELVGPNEANIIDQYLDKVRENRRVILFR